MLPAAVQQKAFFSSHCKGRRILYLIGQLRLGGSERQLYFLLERMNERRFETAVFVWNLRQDDPYVTRIRAFGVPVNGFPSGVSRRTKMKVFRQVVGQFSPEIVHSYTFHTNFAAWWATLGVRSIAIGSVRSDFARAKKDAGIFLGRLSARWPSAQIFNNVAAADGARHSRGFFTPRQLFIIRNGLDLRSYRSLPLPNRQPVCIAGIGSLIPEKRWDRLLLAGWELKKLKMYCSIHIAGEGPTRQRLEQQVQELGLTGQVKFSGSTANIPEFLSDATFLVHASDSEGSPNAVMEAMACGRAVIATAAGDVPRLVEDGKTGFVVPRGDEPALVERMAKLITDQDLCRRMGEAGRAKAEREFGLDRLVCETLAAYRAAGWKE